MAGADGRKLGEFSLEYYTTDEARQRLAHRKRQASVAMAEAALRAGADHQELHQTLSILGLLPEQEALEE